MTDEAKILKSTREAQNLDIRSFADQVNAHLPEGFDFSYAAYSRWERGKRAVPFFAFKHLAESSTGWVQVMAQQVVTAMTPVVVDEPSPVDVQIP